MDAILRVFAPIQIVAAISRTMGTVGCDVTALPTTPMKANFATATEPRKDSMPDTLKPSPALLCKLGSIVVHVEEANAPGGHTFDVVATQQLLADPEVQAWLDGMRKMAMVPVKRTGEPEILSWRIPKHDHLA